MTIPIAIHIIAAAIAIPLGIWIFSIKKGSKLHKKLGWIWVGLLITMAISAVFIDTIFPTSTDDRFSLLHLLIPYTIGSLALAIWGIRKYKKTKSINYKYTHRNAMIGLYCGGLILAGAFALVPGRAVHTLVTAWFN